MPQQIAHDDAFLLPSGKGLAIYRYFRYLLHERSPGRVRHEQGSRRDHQLTDKTSEAYLTAESRAVFVARLSDDSDVVYEGACS